MRSLGLVLVALSILIGGVALWGLKILDASRAEAAPSRPAAPQTRVVVAAQPIAFGETIGPGDLKLQSWPAGAAPAGSFRSIAQLTAGQPRLALTSIPADTPILPQEISGAGGRATLAALIRPGMRAATLRVDDVLGVGGFVLPGDSVDILVTRQDGQKGQARTNVLLQGVRVLAVDQLDDEAKNKPVVAKSATVEVTPDQAEKIALAAQVGALSLALRSSGEPPAAGDAPVRVIRVSDLGDGPSPAKALHARRPRVAKPAPAGPGIEVYRGVEAVRVSVPAE